MVLPPRPPACSSLPRWELGRLSPLPQYTLVLPAIKTIVWLSVCLMLALGKQGYIFIVFWSSAETKEGIGTLGWARGNPGKTFPRGLTWSAHAWRQPLDGVPLLPAVCS